MTLLLLLCLKSGKTMPYYCVWLWKNPADRAVLLFVFHPLSTNVHTSFTEWCRISWNLSRTRRRRRWWPVPCCTCPAWRHCCWDAGARRTECTPNSRPPGPPVLPTTTTTTTTTTTKTTTTTTTILGSLLTVGSQCRTMWPQSVVPGITDFDSLDRRWSPCPLMLQRLWFRRLFQTAWITATLHSAASLEPCLGSCNRFRTRWHGYSWERADESISHQFLGNSTGCLSAAASTSSWLC